MIIGFLLLDVRDCFVAGYEIVRNEEEEETWGGGMKDCLNKWTSRRPRLVRGRVFRSSSPRGRLKRRFRLRK